MSHQSEKRSGGIFGAAGWGALFLLCASQRTRKKQTAAPAPARLFLPQAAGPCLLHPPEVNRPARPAKAGHRQLERRAAGVFI